MLSFLPTTHITNCSDERELNIVLNYISVLTFQVEGGGRTERFSRSPRLFFDNLQRVQAWIGGVRQDMLERWVGGGQSHSQCVVMNGNLRGSPVISFQLWSAVISSNLIGSAVISRNLQ